MSSPGPQPLIALADLTVTLPSEAGPVQILRGLSFAVQPGETVAITGPSGSGKSTLLLVLGGLERATSGRVQVAGADLSALGEDALARLRRDRIGIVFQGFHLIPTMSALENVAVPLELAGVGDATERARAALQAVRLGHRLTHFPAQLSGGEQQRVALARAFAARPALILADEPTGNLDGETGRVVIDLLFAQAAETGATLMLITHDLTLAARCQRQIRLADGRILADHPTTAAAA